MQTYPKKKGVSLREQKSSHITSYESTKKWRLNNPVQFSANRKVYEAKRSGKLIQSPCEICGDVKSEAHHEDYTKPLDVMWLCKTHHFEVDQKRRQKNLSPRGEDTVSKCAKILKVGDKK